jgi:hypothetical protein
VERHTFEEDTVTKANRDQKHLTIPIDARRLRGLQFEAHLLTEVFNYPFTAADVALSHMERSIREREHRLAK